MNAGLITKSRLRHFAVLAICAAPVILAFERAGRNIAPELQPGQANIFERPHDKAEAEHQRAMHPGPVSEEEWSAAKEFLELHSRNRMRAIEKLSGEPREGLKRSLVNHWHVVTQLQSQSPELYKTRVREIELNDEIFGDCLELKHGHVNAKVVQADLNTKITELFNLGLTERRQRIGLVEKSLVDQKKSLESDEHDKAHLIQQYYETVLARGVEGARLDVPRHTGSKSKPDASTAPSSPGEEK